MLVSTIQGDSQLHLIQAARRARVRTFVPSEFEGPLAHRPTADDPLDHGSAAALRLLSELSSPSSSHRMRYTVFTCGVFYERFHPGGLAFYNMGAGANVQLPGDYLLDVNAATAEIVQHNAQGGLVALAMTSVYDLARYVAGAIEIGPENWPEELRMRGDQLTVLELVQACSTARAGMSCTRPYTIATVCFNHQADSPVQPRQPRIRKHPSTPRVRRRNRRRQSMVVFPATPGDGRRAVYIWTREPQRALGAGGRRRDRAQAIRGLASASVRAVPAAAPVVVPGDPATGDTRVIMI